MGGKGSKTINSKCYGLMETGQEERGRAASKRGLLQGQVLRETTRIRKSYYCLMMKAINFQHLVFLRKSGELEENVILDD